MAKSTHAAWLGYANKATVISDSLEKKLHSQLVPSSSHIADTTNVIFTLFTMWQILEHIRLNRRFEFLPIDVLKRYEKWKDIVSISGSESLGVIRGFRDEALRGPWKGFRSPGIP